MVDSVPSFGGSWNDHSIAGACHRTTCAILVANSHCQEQLLLPVGIWGNGHKQCAKREPTKENSRTPLPSSFLSFFWFYHVSPNPNQAIWEWINDWLINLHWRFHVTTTTEMSIFQCSSCFPFPPLSLAYPFRSSPTVPYPIPKHSLTFQPTFQSFPS